MLFLGVFIGVLGSSWALTGCPSGVREGVVTIYGDHCYQFVDRGIEWTSAGGECRKNGGYLARVNSMDEMSYIANTARQYYRGRDLWFGLNDRSSEGSWRFEDGSAPRINYWRSGYPEQSWYHAFKYTRDCAIMVADRTYQWQEVVCWAAWVFGSYYGFVCEYEVNACELTPDACGIGGTCVDEAVGFSCNCRTGFAGEYCEININDCHADACNHHGTCIDGDNTFYCNCNQGYTGDQCQSLIDYCQMSNCNHGDCVNDLTGFTCDCHDGYSGATCTEDIDDCAIGPCLNAGVCIDEVNGYSCECSNGFAGNDCETNIDDCSNDPCGNEEGRGFCTDLVDGYECQCSVGFSGDQCHIDIDYCEDAPCGDYGTCTDGLTTFTCDCDEGFNGDRCEMNIDDCALADQPCGDNGICIDGINEFVCECDGGFDGPDCSVNIDDCAGVEDVCNGQGTCIDGIQSYTCMCDDGYDGEYCNIDIDECAGDPCYQGTCVDLVAHYECRCSEGYTGDLCDVLDENVLGAISLSAVQQILDDPAIQQDPAEVEEYSVSAISEGGGDPDTHTSGMVMGETSLFTENGLSIGDTLARGWNIAVLDRQTGTLTQFGQFDTWTQARTDTDPVGRMTAFLQGIAEDSVVLMGVWISGNKCEGDCFTELGNLGCAHPQPLKYAESYACIGYKQGNGCIANPSWVTDAHATNPKKINAVNWTEPVSVTATIPVQCQLA